MSDSINVNESVETSATVQTVESAPEAILKAFGKCAMSAAKAALHMGTLGSEYITARLALSESTQRTACIASLMAAWQDHSDNVVTAIRVNELIRTAATHALFNGDAKGKGKVSLRVIREFSPLCERDTTARAETWKIAEALATEAKALWTEATVKSLNGDECGAAVAKLIAAHKAQLAEDAKKTAETEKFSAASVKAREDAEKVAKDAKDKADAKEAKVNPPAAPATVPTTETVNVPEQPAAPPVPPPSGEANVAILPDSKPHGENSSEDKRKPGIAACNAFESIVNSHDRLAAAASLGQQFSAIETDGEVLLFKVLLGWIEACDKPSARLAETIENLCKIEKQRNKSKSKAA